MTETPSGSPPLRVLVVDRDERVVESLAGLLGIGDRCVVVGGASEPADALAELARSAPDVVILDPRLPEMDAGRDFITRVRALAPQTRVIVMSSADGLDHDGLAALADGVIRKTFRPRELIEAVCAAAGIAVH